MTKASFSCILFRNMEYDESKIQSLSPLEHIRLRPGMYIGRLGNGTHEDDGIYVLLKEIIDNSVDEFIMHAGSKIVISRKENTCTVRDFGRGFRSGRFWIASLSLIPVPNTTTMCFSFP